MNEVALTLLKDFIALIPTITIPFKSRVINTFNMLIDVLLLLSVTTNTLDNEQAQATERYFFP